MKKYLFISVFIILCGFAIFHPKNIKKTTDDFVLVHTLTADVKDIPFIYNTVGTVTPLQEVIVKTQISGELTKIMFNEGDMVTKGQIIALIDDKKPKAELNKAKADLATVEAKLQEAEINLQRYKKLQNKAIISQKELDEQTALYKELLATVQSCKAQVEIAQINYEHTKIKAPITGRIGLKNITQGNLVLSTDTAGIASIVQTSPISVFFSLPQQLFSSLDNIIHNQVIVFDNATETELGQGKITALDNTFNTQSGTIQVRADFDNRSKKLYPGQFVNVNFIYGHNKDHIVLPNEVIRAGLENSYVFKIDNNKAVTVPVSTAYADAQNTVISFGVSAGDIIISDNFFRLKNGTTVKISTKDNK